MIKTKVQKLWKGCVSIRDYVVTEAIERDEPLQVKFNDDVMVLQPKDLKTKQMGKSVKLQSNFGDKEYMLIDYEWEPTVAPKLF